jgi:hypothetical protein
MCDNFKNQFFEKVLERVGQDTFVLDVLKKSYGIEYYPCRNIHSVHHPKCQKYFLKCQTVYGKSCFECQVHYCMTCATTCFFSRNSASIHSDYNSYTQEQQSCFECFIQKDYFIPKVIQCSVCLNTNSSTFIYEQNNDAFFCYNCRSRTYKNNLKSIQKATNVVACGTTQDTATPLSQYYSIVSRVPLNSGVVLPEMTDKRNYYEIVNKSSNYLHIYPSIGSSIGKNNVNVPILLSPHSSVTLAGDMDNHWTEHLVLVSNSPQYQEMKIKL